MTRRTNYLNNKDILKEIHRSKITYCSFSKPEYADFDLTVDSVEDLFNRIEEGRAARAKRLIVLAQDASIEADGVKMKADDTNIKVEDILTTDVIFRVPCWDHIPEAPVVIKPVKAKSKKAKPSVIDEDLDIIVTEYDEQEPEIEPPVPGKKYIKINFPPFVHYKLTDTNELELVGRSHWKGPLDGGEFCKDHGHITNKLATMFLKHCERYATRYNWRGYSYVDEMRAQALLQLSRIGLQFDEHKSSNPFAYYTTAIKNSFTRVFNIEKNNQNIRDDILEMNNLSPSFGRQHSDDDHGGDE